MVAVSFVIVTYFSHDYIEGCIASIRRFASGHEDSCEIVIVDQSTDEGYDKLIGLIGREPHALIIIRNKKNGGYGQGNNLGIKSAQGSIVVVINPDVLLPDAGFEQISNTFKADDKLVMAGGKQFGGINLSFWVRPEYNFPLFTTPLSFILNKMNLYLEKYMFLSGAMLILDKQKFFEVGLFDENIFLYFEESDITRRIRAKGFKTKYIKDLRYKHLVDETKKTTDHQFEIEFTSAQYYFRKYDESFKRFLNNKIFSYKVQLPLLYILNRKQSYKNARKNLNRVSKLVEKQPH